MKTVYYSLFIFGILLAQGDSVNFPIPNILGVLVCAIGAVGAYLMHKTDGKI